MANIPDGLTGVDVQRQEALQNMHGAKFADASEIAAVLDETLSFTQFTEAAQFGPSGFYEQIDFHRGDLPLLPEQFSPHFGDLFADMAPALFTRVFGDYDRGSLAFLGLAAGGGFLDYDLIQRVADPNYEDFDDEDGAPTNWFKTVRNRAQFIVSDTTDMSLELLGRKVSDFESHPLLGGRVETERLDARNFDIGDRSFDTGFVYANELIDALPTEPVIDVDGQYWLVRMLPYRPDHDQVIGEIAAKTGVVGDMQPDRFLEAVKAGDNLSDTRFKPVFVPLFTDPELQRLFNDIDGPSRISSKTHDGLLPLHHHVDGIFRSSMRSFGKGIVSLVDYMEIPQNQFNYHMAVNTYSYPGDKRFVFGQTDVNFQVDHRQVMMIGQAEGATPFFDESLGPYLRFAMTGDEVALQRQFDPPLIYLTPTDLAMNIAAGVITKLEARTAHADVHRILNFAFDNNRG